MRVFGTILWLAAAPACAAPLLSPGHVLPPELDFRTDEAAAALPGRAAAGAVNTLPNWSFQFAIGAKSYNATLLGTDPANGPALTVIPTLLVPLRITVPDYLVNGQPLVLDAGPQMQDVEDSPIFTPAKFDSGTLQFADAMLHAEFRTAPKSWHVTFAPSVAPVLDVTAPAGAVEVRQSKTGRYLGIIVHPGFLNKPFKQVLETGATPNQYVVFVSYNSLLGGAYGFHSWSPQPGGAISVWAYNSWLKGVNDLFSLPSPDADTFAHEIAETVHDPFGTSRTKAWGDWFNGNTCFQRAIEVGDAVEDAPAKVQNYKQTVTVRGRERVYTLQTEALLPWFERIYPSNAIHGAYSWPGEQVLLGPAPLDCVKSGAAQGHP